MHEGHKDIKRTCVNFLRHECTEYDEHLYQLIGRVGRDEGYILIKSKVLGLIADKYPFLKKECNKQKEELLL